MDRIGFISVDAGIVMVGDPCYTLPDDGSHRDYVAREWGAFCNATFSEPTNAEGYSEPLGDGIGLVVSSGYGDGRYPVYVERNAEGRVARLIVEFIDDEDDDEECNYCSNPAEYDGECADCHDDDDEEE